MLFKILRHDDDLVQVLSSSDSVISVAILLVTDKRWRHFEPYIARYFVLESYIGNRSTMLMSGPFQP